MKTVHVHTPRTLSRRHFLRGAGVLLGLPLLDAMVPAFARADTKSLVPRRFFGICNNLGVLPDRFFPRDRKSTRLNSSHVSISYAVFCLKKKNKALNFFKIVNDL